MWGKCDVKLPRMKREKVVYQYPIAGPSTFSIAPFVARIRACLTQVDLDFC